MRSLWLLTKKNLRLLIRAKSSALIVVFAPLLIILILGLSFNNSAKYGLNIGIAADSFTDDVNGLVTLLQEEEFKIVKYENSLEGCIEDIKLGFVHTCLSLPESFKIEGNTQKEITFYVDPSKVNLVWMIQDSVKKKLNIKAQEISEELAGNVLTRLADTNTKITTEKDKLSGVKEKSSTAASSVEASKTGLSSLDLAAPSTEHDLSIVDTFRDNLSASIDSSSSKINSALIAVSGANMSASLKLTLTTMLEQAETKLNTAVKLINGTSGVSLVAVVDLVNTLNEDLNSAKGKLTSASEQVSTTASSLESTRTTLNEAVTTLSEIQTALDEVKANLDAQTITDAGVITSPLITHLETVIPKSTHLNYLFSGLIVLVIMFSSLLLGTTLVMMEKNSPAFIRNFFLPVKKITFVLSIYFTNLILGLIQVVIILGISLIFLPDTLNSIPLMALILFLAASVFTFLGMAIGYAFTSEDTAVLGSISLGSLMLFFSGLILPLEGISPTIRELTFYNPFVIAEKLVREVFIFNTSIDLIWMDFAFLIGYTLILFLVIMILESILHKHLIDKYIHRHHKILKRSKKKEKKRKKK
ncbi:MAG: ABC transporter permease [Nanoarchaeota archaeon]|nr:ABC transporter permease [Nanoarchaeota archaeon]